MRYWVKWDGDYIDPPEREELEELLNQYMSRLIKHPECADAAVFSSLNDISPTAVFIATESAVAEERARNVFDECLPDGLRVTFTTGTSHELSGPGE